MGPQLQQPRPSAAAWYPPQALAPCFATLGAHKNFFLDSKVFVCCGQPWDSIELIKLNKMEKTVCILVQQSKKQPINYVHCEVIKGDARNFALHKAYISKFDNPLQIGKAYVIKHRQSPSECGNYTNISVSVLAELSEAEKVRILLGD
jgi:hypothetical protein